MPEWYADGRACVVLGLRSTSPRWLLPRMVLRPRPGRADARGAESRARDAIDFRTTVKDNAGNPMRRDFVRLAAALFGVACAAACASLLATGCSGDDSSVVAGSDAALDTGAADAASDAGVTSADASPLTYLDGSAQCAPDGGHGGHRWQDLYACYFGARPAWPPMWRDGGLPQQRRRRRHLRGSNGFVSATRSTPARAGRT